MTNPKPKAWRKWWIDPTPCDEDMPNVFDAFSEHPGQGHLSWQASLIKVIEVEALHALERERDELFLKVRAERDELKTEVERLKAVVDGKIEAIPEGIILVKRANYKIDDPVFSEAERRFKYKYFFIHAPLDWDGQWEKVEPDLLISAIRNRIRG